MTKYAPPEDWVSAMDQAVRAAKDVATMIRALYDASLAEGFTEQDAMRVALSAFRTITMCNSGSSSDD